MCIQNLSRWYIIFQYNIPLNHPEEEDLSFDELERKILIRENHVYNSQSIDAFYDEDEDLEPSSVYYGLAYCFNGAVFSEGDDELNELEEYFPEDGEEEESMLSPKIRTLYQD